MLTRFSDWKRPTDAAYAFRVRPFGEIQLRKDLDRVDIRDVTRAALVEGDGERFERRLHRWDGPEDRLADGTQPYIAPQNEFRIVASAERLAIQHVEEVLRGTALVFEHGAARVSYVMRDHHTLDAMLLHAARHGVFPRRLFHADRHSDWCGDGHLETHRPAQAATWWKLLDGLKQPDGVRPLLREEDVVFTTAVPTQRDGLSGRDVGSHALRPWFVDAADLPWQRALEREGALGCDWVSLDLDFFLPLAQWRETGGLVRDARFARLMRDAAVRIFVLSPQFTNGGDRHAEWLIRGRRHTTLRLLRVLMSLGSAQR